MLVAFMLEWCFITNFLYLVLHEISNTLNLDIGGCFTNDKEICNRFRDLPEIKRKDLFALFFLDSFDDRFKDFRTPVNTGCAFCLDG